LPVALILHETNYRKRNLAERSEVTGGPRNSELMKRDWDNEVAQPHSGIPAPSHWTRNVHNIRKSEPGMILNEETAIWGEAGIARNICKSLVMVW
jgi:hypothetical protein